MATRILECPCGVELAGADDAELFASGREHADEHHRDENIPDDFIRDHVRANAKGAVE